MYDPIIAEERVAAAAGCDCVGTDAPIGVTILAIIRFVIEVLNEGVERMKRVREEYLNRIKGLDQEMKSLAGGSAE